MKLAGALLAAGGSSRFGRPKAFLEFRGATLLRRQAAELAAVAAPALIVIPPPPGAYARELSGLGVQIVLNRLAGRGIGRSIATAARSLATFAPEAGALLIALVDQPMAERTLFETLRDAASGGSGWAACDYGDGTIGPPAIFPREAFAGLSELDGDRGARPLLDASRSRLALVDFPAGRIDVDTPGDYERLLALESAPEP